VQLNQVHKSVAVSPFGPLFFYAAMFEKGTLSLDTLASNGAVWEFSLE